MARRRPSLSCIVYDLTEAEALRVLIERHSTSKGLNAFCRTVLALQLEPSIREAGRERAPGDGSGVLPSKLTKAHHLDVRAEIARAAGVSTGNVTKVKQLLDAAIPELRDALRRGEISIHRAWQWRGLSAMEQRGALSRHRHQHDLPQIIRRLIASHAGREGVIPAELVRMALQRSPPHDWTMTALTVVDLPGNALLMTRECYDSLITTANR